VLDAGAVAVVAIGRGGGGSDAEVHPATRTATSTTLDPHVGIRLRPTTTRPLIVLVCFDGRGGPPVPALARASFTWRLPFVHLWITFRNPIKLMEIVMNGSVLASLPNIEGWRQVEELSLALVLSAVIGVEREIRQKSAGLRTHALVGVGAGLFMLISKYSFSDVVVPRLIVLDPSRVAAQIVTGIGFIGGGLIFVRRDGVRGLTTAAAVWVTAAIGAAAGGGLPVLALLATGLYFVVVVGFPPLVRHLPTSATAVSVIRIRYADGRGILRDVLSHATGRGFSVAEVATQSIGTGTSSVSQDELEGSGSFVEVTLQIFGRGSVNDLAAELSEIAGVDAVVADDVNSAAE
jgi:putative Mg2+ transporter-C (MgtC) family protein